MKALIGTFNQENALVGAFSVIVKTGYETDGSFYSTSRWSTWAGAAALCLVRVRMLTDWQQQPATTVKVRCPLTSAWLHDNVAGDHSIINYQLPHHTWCSVNCLRINYDCHHYPILWDYLLVTYLLSMHDIHTYSYLNGRCYCYHFISYLQIRTP